MSTPADRAHARYLDQLDEAARKLVDAADDLRRTGQTMHEDAGGYRDWHVSAAGSAVAAAARAFGSIDFGALIAAASNADIARRAATPNDSPVPAHLAPPKD